MLLPDLIKEFTFAVAIIGMIVLCITIAYLRIAKVHNEMAITFVVILFFSIVVCLVRIIAR